jgi:hypothetical protein
MFSPEPLSSASDANKTAFAFGVLYAHVLQTTVTRDNVRTLHLERGSKWRRWKWIVSALDGLTARSFQLTNGTWLFAAQTLGVRESSLEPGNYWLTTLKYTYQWQTDADNASWIVRWCYSREDPAGNLIPSTERGHVHVNATPAGYMGSDHFPDLHLPAGRIGIEDLAAYLIGPEVGCSAISDKADEVIEEAREIFRTILRRV